MQDAYNDSAAVNQLDELKNVFGVKNRANKGVVAPAAAAPAAADPEEKVATIKKELKNKLDQYKKAQALSNTYQKMKRLYDQTIGMDIKPIINNGPPCEEKDDDDDGDDDAEEEEEEEEEEDDDDDSANTMISTNGKTEDDNAVKIALNHEIEVSNIKISMGNMEVDKIIQKGKDIVDDQKKIIDSFETFYKKNVASLKISDDKTPDSAEDKDLGLIKFESERNLDASIDFFIRYRDELISTYKKIFTLEKPTTTPPEFGTEYTQSAVDKYKASLQKIYDNYSKKYSGDVDGLKTLLEYNKPSELPFVNPTKTTVDETVNNPTKTTVDEIVNNPTKTTVDKIVNKVNEKFTEMDTLIGEKITGFKEAFAKELGNIDVKGAIFSDATKPDPAAADASEETKTNAANAKAAYVKAKDEIYNNIVKEIKENIESAIKAFTAFKNEYLANIAEVIDCEIELNNFDKFIKEKTDEKDIDIAREVLNKITISVEPGSYVLETSQQQNSYDSVLTPRDKLGAELRMEEMITEGANTEAATKTKGEIIDGLKSDPAFKEGLEAEAKKELTEQIMLDIGTKINTSAKDLIDAAAAAATAANAANATTV
jgi:hypothetical protein